MGKMRITAATAALACALFGCGAFVPEFVEIYDTTAAAPDALIDAIISHVHCELKGQIEFLILDDIEAALAWISMEADSPNMCAAKGFTRLTNCNRSIRPIGALIRAHRGATSPRRTQKSHET